jgi:hypothetical protein
VFDHIGIAVADLAVSERFYLRDPRLRSSGRAPLPEDRLSAAAPFSQAGGP